MDQPRHVFKRVKERSIMDAKQSVDEWRKLFKSGEIDKNGNRIKYSLKQAAEKVGVPKKTLEDYHQLLKKAEQIIDLNEVGDKKMGFLRNLIRYQPQHQQMQPGAISYQENNIKQEKMEEQIEGQWQKQEEFDNYEDMIVDGDIDAKDKYQYEELYIVTTHQQLILDKKLEITYSDCEDCETNDEFDE